MLLQEKTKKGFDQLYDAYACNLYAFIFFVTNEEKKADELLSKTFIMVWNEPILKLQPLDSFIWLMQKASHVLLENSRDITDAKEKIISYIKMTKKQIPQLKIVVPESRINYISNEAISRPSA